MTTTAKKAENASKKNGSARKELTKAQKKKLFDAAFEAHAHVAELEAAVREAKAAESGAIEAIFETLGGGEFRYEGSLKAFKGVVVRAAKNRSGFFFKGLSGSMVETIG